MKNSTRIAYFHPYWVLYGAGRSLLETLKQLDRSKFIPHLVVAHEGPFLEEAKAGGIETTLLPWIANVTCKRPLVWLRTVWRLSRWLRSHQIKIVELNLWPAPMDGGVLYAAARLAGARFILRNRVQLPSWLSLYDRWWLSRADRIISVSDAAVSPALRKRRSDFWFRLRRDRVAIVPSGRNLKAVEHQASSNGFFLETLGIPNRSRIVGMVGTINPGKRQDLFLRAASIVSKTDPDAWFLVVGAPYYISPGETEYLQSLHELSGKLGISHRVIFTGHRDDVLSLMGHFDVLVLPSRNEGIGSVLIEAMALGIPAVASSVGGIPEVVKDGKTGLLVNSSEPEAYAAAILRFLSDSQYAKRVGASAKQWVKNFDSVRVTRLVERCYEEVMGGCVLGQDVPLEVRRIV